MINNIISLISYKFKRNIFMQVAVSSLPFSIKTYLNLLETFPDENLLYTIKFSRETKWFNPKFYFEIYNSYVYKGFSFE